jgi:hypothetical protein
MENGYPGLDSPLSYHNYFIPHFRRPVGAHTTFAVANTGYYWYSCAVADIYGDPAIAKIIGQMAGEINNINQIIMKYFLIMSVLAKYPHRVAISGSWHEYCGKGNDAGEVFERVWPDKKFPVKT